VLRGSCGCYSPEELVQWDNRQLQRQILLRVREETEYYETLNMVRQNLAISDTEGLFNFYLMEVMKKFSMYGHCMCVNQNIYYGTQPIEMEIFSKYDEEQYIFSCMKQGKEEVEDRLIKTKDLVPSCLQQQDDETHVYMCMALHRFGACIGYVVLVDAKGILHRKMGLYMMGAINGAYSNLRNLENLRKMNKRLDAVYVKDALTDMYNRFGYMRDGYEMFEKCKAYGKPLMVMFMDMDRLKEINDIYGHSHGDNALIIFSDVLKSCAGEDKIAVRYGGDEFLIIGQVEDKEEAEAFKCMLEKALDDANAKSGLPYQIEASIGYVLTDAKSTAELDDYVEEADELMYEVKKRNRKNRQSYSAQ
jgi:diguanylate cyclase (GGDEF)-like protein